MKIKYKILDKIGDHKHRAIYFNNYRVDVMWFRILGMGLKTINTKISLNTCNIKGFRIGKYLIYFLKYNEL